MMDFQFQEEMEQMEQELRRRHHQSQQKSLNNKKHRKKRRSTAEDYIDDEEDADYVEEEFGSSSGRRTTTKTRRKKRPKETTEIMPTWKLCAVGAAIFLCFALLYPSVFSPMLGSLFGSRRAAEEAGTSRTVHPSMVGPNPSGGQREPKPPGRQMHPGPAAMPQMQQAQTGTGGGSRGGFAWLLPFYTVGVVCFLLYTLFKVKFKRKTKQQQKNRRNNSSNFWEDGGDESASDTYGANGGQKLRAVQSRLRKTEMAMQEILQQLELLAAQSQQFTQPMATANVGNAGGDGVAADGPPAQAVPEEPTSGEETASNRTTNQNAGGAGGGLSAEQTSMMEQRLKELKLLSALCKRDQKLGRRLRDHSSTEEEEESEDEDALVDDEEAEDGEEEEEVGSQTEEEDEEAEENESELEQSNNKDEQRHKSD